MKKRLFVLICLFAFIMMLCSCKKEEVLFECDITEPALPSDFVSQLNENIINLQKLAFCYVNGEKVLYFERKNNNVYSLFFDSGTRLRFSTLSSFMDSLCPSVSMVMNDGFFLWTINNELLSDSYGVPFDVDFEMNLPELLCENGSWSCQMGENRWADLDVKSIQPVSLEEESGFIMVSLPTGCKFVLEKTDFYSGINRVTANKAFYKDIFMDAGIGLTSRTRLAAALYLRLSLECMSFSSDEDMELQNQLIEGDSLDYNGRLLYPDGQPRYQMLFVNGGGANTHGQSLTEGSHENMRKFVKEGGSYVGTCAGSSFASMGFNGPAINPNYLHIWPEFVKRTNLLQSRTGFIIEPSSPLLDYFDFGGDLYVDSVRHNNGNYPSQLPPGGEVLARYDYPASDSIHLQPSAWAYREGIYTGRIIQIGSHPEEVWSGERRDLAAAALLYAMDGCGATKVKGILQNGIPREMTKTTWDNDPDYTRIGDLQCHHFIVFIPRGIKEVSFSVQSDADVDLSLMLNRNGFAFEEDAQYSSTGSGPNQQLVFQSLSPGLWYVAVKCNTTVSVIETEWGQEYTGRTDVLNGVPYRVKVSWTTPEEQTVLKKTARAA